MTDFYAWLAELAARGVLPEPFQYAFFVRGILSVLVLAPLLGDDVDHAVRPRVSHASRRPCRCESPSGARGPCGSSASRYRAWRLADGDADGVARRGRLFAFANALRHARRAMRRHRIVRRSIERVLLSRHPRPVFVLGNQKSGTTAIAALLSVATALPATLDFFHTLPERVLVDLLEGRSTLATLVRREPRPFARPIVKEPQLTFVAAALVEAFPESRFAFVLRDPRDNIRSILNRVGIAGTAQSLGAQDRARLGRKPGWLGILDGHVFGCPGRSLVETLALRWNLAVGALAVLPAHTARLRYEDFEADKQGRIEALAHAVGLAATHSIAARVNERFQPSGDRSLSWPEFFGAENLGLIEATCAAGMRTHGYRPTV